VQAGKQLAAVSRAGGEDQARGRGHGGRIVSGKQMDATFLARPGKKTR
jgi:hypothetical protein